MPNITSAGTYTQSNPGFNGLRSTNSTKDLIFAGTAIATTTVEYQDDTGSWHTTVDGSISALPTTLTVNANVPLRVVVTGSPDFNLTIKERS